MLLDRCRDLKAENLLLNEDKDLKIIGSMLWLFLSLIEQTLGSAMT